MAGVPEAEPTPAAEPEVEPEAEAEPTFVSYSFGGSPMSHSESSVPSVQSDAAAAGVAEPVPEWSVAVPEWAEAWDFHTYGLASVFALLAIVSFTLLVMIASRRLQGSRLVVPILAFLTILGATRAIFLYGDAYGWRNSYPKVFLQLMNGATLPCLTSSYAILIYSVLRALHPTHSLSKNRTLVQLSVALVAHFTISIAADVVIGLNDRSKHAKYLVIVCNTVFILWGFSLFLLFSLAGWTLRKQLLAGRRLAADGKVDKGSDSVWKRYRRPMVIIGCATVSGIAVSACYIYGMVINFDSFAGESIHPAPWPWWGYQTTARLLEIVMSWLILYATVLTPVNQQQLKQNISASGATLTRGFSRLSMMSQRRSLIKKTFSPGGSSMQANTASPTGSSDQSSPSYSASHDGATSDMNDTMLNTTGQVSIAIAPEDSTGDSSYTNTDL